MLVINWNTNLVEEYLQGYNIYYGFDSNSVNTLVKKVATNSVTFNAYDGLEPKVGDTACFKVSSYNIIGESNYSEILCSRGI